MSEWKKFDGSDEQIAEISDAENGWVVRWMDGSESHPYNCTDHVEFAHEQCGEFSHYWIIPDDPLREMKIRQAQTGQPVWWKSIDGGGTGLCHEYFPPFAHSDAFEYSFTPFEEEV
jgi:hypothetical protein